MQPSVVAWWHFLRPGGTLKKSSNTYYMPSGNNKSWGKKSKATQVQCTQLQNLYNLCIQHVTVVFANCTMWLHHASRLLYYDPEICNSRVSYTLRENLWEEDNLGTNDLPQMCPVFGGFTVGPSIFLKMGQTGTDHVKTCDRPGWLEHMLTTASKLCVHSSWMGLIVLLEDSCSL